MSEMFPADSNIVVANPHLSPLGLPHRSPEKQRWSCTTELHQLNISELQFFVKPVKMAIALRVLTHNVRYATSSPSQNEKPWNERLPLIMSQLFYHSRYLDGEADSISATLGPASIVCLQEVIHRQLHDILSALNEPHGAKDKPANVPNGPTWSYIGVAREDGKTKGEYSPILYPTRVFKLLHFENTWLSPTPDRPSKGWDAGSMRILTTGVFEHKGNLRRVAVFNTHLDNAGPQSRERSIGIILEVIRRTCQRWAVEEAAGNRQRLNYVLAGDFNSFPTQEAYKALQASGEVVDAYDAVPAATRYGSGITFTGFRPDTDEDQDSKGRIDFVFFGPTSPPCQPPNKDTLDPLMSWKVSGYAVLPNVFDNGIFCSDHRAVVADAVLPAE